jgi:hypothetical protein
MDKVLDPLLVLASEPVLGLLMVLVKDEVLVMELEQL